MSCPNASTFSQQYINKPGGRFEVRCGPQTTPPVVHGSRIEQAATNVSPDTRVVPRHVYDKRQNTTNVAVPPGYKAVWDDDRLNPNRAERTLRPAQVAGVVSVPPGYRLVDWDDNRLNLRRGVRTAEGDAQTQQVWSNTVPRVLLTVPAQPQVVRVPKGTARAQDPQTTVRRVSTRSAPATAPKATGNKRLYVRVAAYATDKDARAVAKSLARKGLPMHLGTLKSSGNKVVLAGPFGTDAEARAALGKVQGAGYSGARIK